MCMHDYSLKVYRFALIIGSVIGNSRLLGQLVSIQSVIGNSRLLGQLVSIQSVIGNSRIDRYLCYNIGRLKSIV